MPYALKLNLGSLKLPLSRESFRKEPNQPRSTGLLSKSGSPGISVELVFPGVCSLWFTGKHDQRTTLLGDGPLNLRIFNWPIGGQIQCSAFAGLEVAGSNGRL